MNEKVEELIGVQEELTVSDSAEMSFFAELDSETNICTCVVGSICNLENSNIIRIKEEDYSYIGKLYENGVWSEEVVLPIIVETSESSETVQTTTTEEVVNTELESLKKQNELFIEIFKSLGVSIDDFKT